MDNIRIRRLRIDDADDMSEIYGTITQKPLEINFSQIVEQAQKNGDASFVAEREGKVVGYMIAYVFAGGFGLEQSAWIANLGVMPEFMGRGIGEALAEKIVEHSKSRNITDIYTSVRWDSPDLLSFFKTLDFSQSNFINLLKKINS